MLSRGSWGGQALPPRLVSPWSVCPLGGFLRSFLLPCRGFVVLPPRLVSVPWRGVCVWWGRGTPDFSRKDSQPPRHRGLLGRWSSLRRLPCLSSVSDCPRGPLSWPCSIGLVVRSCPRPTLIITALRVPWKLGGVCFVVVLKLPYFTLSRPCAVHSPCRWHWPGLLVRCGVEVGVAGDMGGLSPPPPQLVRRPPPLLPLAAASSSSDPCSQAPVQPRLSPASLSWPPRSAVSFIFSPISTLYVPFGTPVVSHTVRTRPLQPGDSPLPARWAGSFRSSAGRTRFSRAPVFS